MPSYFYHLKFELFPHPYSQDNTEAVLSSTRRKTGDTHHSTNHIGEEGWDDETEIAKEVWTPTEGTDIFDSQTWPGHRPTVSSLSRGRGDRGHTSGRDGRKGNSAGVVEGGGNIIDCGPSRSSNTVPELEEDLYGAEDTEPVVLPTTHLELSARAGDTHRNISVARRDWRFGRVRIESWDLDSDVSSEEVGNTDMDRSGHRRGQSSSAQVTLGAAVTGINAGLTTGPSSAGGRATKARLEEGKNTEVGWGVVHLYRDGEESVGLGGVEVYNSSNSTSVGEGGEGLEVGEMSRESREEDCTTLCIPAVPSYLTPSDFLGFVGEKTRDEVSHFRMVMTGRMNRYLVLMKFRDGNVARKWKSEWDGKVFNSMEPETCHVTFIKSITFQTPTSTSNHPTNTSFPELSHDPFTPSPSTYLKPFPPPTPNLVELPTCPVCLERMDDTTGLLTILCQHVFHCACLQKWRGSGCPVCRHTNPSPSPNSPSYEPSNPPFGVGDASLCSVCDCTEDLWICLICGYVGCGRYKGGHAKEHWKESAHNFALEIQTQHVWDYAGDLWVHRLIRNKGDGKVVELPNRSSRGPAVPGGGYVDHEEDMVPREKLESIGIEYTHLLTSQLESQRVYFEELVSKAVAKASSASTLAATASARAEEAHSRLASLTLENAKLKEDVIANLEKELAREKKRAERSAEVARAFGKSLTEEKRVSEGLMGRIEHLNGAVGRVEEEVRGLREENEELRESNRDLLFSISAEGRLRVMELEGGVGGLEKGELEGGMVSLPEGGGNGPKRKKGKGKK